ncbi:hypothetical protein EDB19DRAFT_1927007 [Suillus lakei]|nr:hypothetical protein EDB19DRAFT_1927007 [Suillus lakei]
MAAQISAHKSTAFTNLPNYVFASHQLGRTLHVSTKQPTVLMFEIANDFIRQNTDFEIVGGYLNPTGLVSAHHRVTLATEQEPSWLMVDSWEVFQNYQRTAIVLDHLDYEINTVLGGVSTRDGEHHLISTMSEPGIWSHDDLDYYVPGRHGTFVIDSLARWRNNIYPIAQLVQNDIPRRKSDLQYLLPAAVIDYIRQNNLYPHDGACMEKDKGKGGGEADITSSESSNGRVPREQGYQPIKENLKRE